MTNTPSFNRQYLSFLANFLTDTLYLPSESKTQQNWSEPSSEEYHKGTKKSTTEDFGSQKDQFNTIKESQKAYQHSENLTQDKTESSDPSGPINYYGGYQHSVLVLVNHQSSRSLIPKDRLVLENILGAVNLSFSDVAVVNISQKSDLTSQRILEEFKPKEILGFGLPDNFLNDQVESYSLAVLDDGYSIVIGDPLSTIATQKNLKVKLWHSLKQMFSLT